MKIEGSVALVTGANRGIGRAFAEALVARGAKKVYAAARDVTSIAIPGVVPVQLDVTDPSSIAALAAEAGDVTLVINNAGISKNGGALDASAVERARAEMETNYIGPLLVSQAFAPALGRHGGGAIVNVLSALSWAVLPSSATYSASKAAAWALTNGLRSELAPQGTQVVGVHFGFVDTDMTSGLGVPKEKPAAIVQRTLDGLEAGASEVLADDTSKNLKAAFPTGVYLRAIGG